MSDVTLPPHSYQVGWICAVETEYVVACELLDEEHATAYHDEHNQYTCGRMGSHNVVLACLPSGKYGISSATSVAQNMLRSFPSIRFGLMVGIGGGAPSQKTDIRLGDVVVSRPVGRTGGVVYYDFGKLIQNKMFEWTGSLNSPPPLLLSAVQKLITNHKRRGHKIAETVEQMIQRNPRLKKDHAKPNSEADVLYRSTFQHLHQGQPCQGFCDSELEHIVQRPARDAQDDDPAIHYGLIASADKLMKDAETRDYLSETEGVLCFEMEAAGLMDDFPCLVIRGICDYSDTHKNDEWQGYAASTAAAYAKELLSVIPSQNVESMSQPAQMPATATQKQVSVPTHFTGHD